MSIFSKIKGAKKAAEQHKGAKAQNAEVKPVVPYRHVPTHAAIDALSGAPSTWKEKDRAEIKVQNQRRSAIIRNNSNLSQITSANTSINRNSSNLSQVTSMNTTLNRNSSYLSSNSSYSKPPPARLETRRSHYGYQGYNNYSTHIGRSPLASNQISPTASSGTSTSSSSSQILELPPATARVRNSNIFQHLHTSTHRQVGEAPLYEVAPTPQVKPVVTTTVTPIETKKRSWGFGRRSSAIAAH